MSTEKNEENYLIRDLETGALEIHIKSKEAYLKLSSTNLKLIKNKFRWSRPGNCWLSKADFNLCHAVVDRFLKLGYQDQGWKGSRIPFEKKILQRLNKNSSIAIKYDVKSQMLQRKAVNIERYIERRQQLLAIEPDRFVKQDLKRQIQTAESKAVSALEMANFYSEQSKIFLERSAVLVLNLTNPKYLKSQLNKNNIQPILEKQKNVGISNRIDVAPAADKLNADRRLFIGRLKTAQEQTLFYKNKLRNIVEHIAEDMTLFYGKPVFMSKRSAPDGIGLVVGHIPEDSKLVLKLNDGTYIAKELEKLSILQPAYEILQVLNSREIKSKEKTRIEGFRALAMIKTDKPLEAMQIIRKAGLASQCMVRCSDHLKNQIKLKKSLIRSKKLGF
ncbi:hypothetical protein [Sphingobacterium sp. UME9]|uniref:hypothetical protein n=1 Tax=Sphingobacterium TaxID=28453 RepID=UPI0016007CD4|nr:hypothetical protein [Sphingobacterium sp. UME9]MBB1642785.1 hypothetical protein [Sphingobacterium sp. UME9]